MKYSINLTYIWSITCAFGASRPEGQRQQEQLRGPLPLLTLTHMYYPYSQISWSSLANSQSWSLDLTWMGLKLWPLWWRRGWWFGRGMLRLGLVLWCRNWMNLAWRCKGWVRELGSWEPKSADNFFARQCRRFLPIRLGIIRWVERESFLPLMLKFLQILHQE